MSLVYWIQFASLMMQIRNLQTVGQATTLMNNSKLFVIRILYHAMNNTKGLLMFFLSISHELSLAFIAFMMLLILMNFEQKQKKLIGILIAIRFVVSTAFLACLSMALSMGTVPKGIAWANQMGMIFMIISLVLVLLFLILIVLNFIFDGKGLRD